VIESLKKYIEKRKDACKAKEAPPPPPAASPPPPETTDAGEKAKDWALKTAGVVIGGIGTAGAIVVIGSGVLWVRFREAGLPPIQAVSVQERQEALVQGAEATIIGLLVAAGAVALMYVIDRDWGAMRLVLRQNETEQERERAEAAAKEAERKGKRPHSLNAGALGVLVVLTVVAVAYVLMTGLGPGSTALLAVLAVALGVIAFWFGANSEKSFWSTAAVVFVSSIVFAGAVGFAVVKDQKYVQAVAILRDGNDRGLTGYYVAVTDKKIYFANSIGIGTAPAKAKPREAKLLETGPDRKPMQEIPLTDSVTYSVGPLESAADATLRAKAMLNRLIAVRDANPDGEKPPLPEKPETLSQVAGAFLRVVVINRKITTRSPRCLVRYTAAHGRALGHWWTTCPNAQRLGPIENVREKLALPNRGRSLDMWVRGSVPVDSSFISLRGRAAPRCEHAAPKPCGHRYSGGGALYYVFDPSQIEVEEKKCTNAREDQPPRWGSCKKTPAN
jgi:hypothetical protein